MDAGVRRQTTIADHTFESRFPRSDEPGERRSHRMAVTTDALGIDFRTLAEEIDRSLHVEDVLPRQTFAADDVLEKQEPFEIAALQRCIPPFAEAGGVGTENDVAFLRERDPGVMHRASRQSCGFDF